MTSILLMVQVMMGVAFTVLFAYQAILMALGLWRRLRKTKTPSQESIGRQGCYAAVICARNEQAVIAQLLATLRSQEYPEELLDLYVVADNCTDDTAAVARDAGAMVYERFDRVRVGKGYAMDDFFNRLHAAGLWERYDGYFVFDADNLVDPQFVREMDRTFRSGQYAAVTSYRNSKNYGDNWISAGYSLWFLREARFLNAPRMALGSSCTVSGTGFLIAAQTIRENGGWPFHLLTEDLQFSADCAVEGRRIAYCDTAVLYDEQPTKFRQSWDQRLRWSRGFYQVALHHGPQLLRSMGQGDLLRRLSSFDVLVVISTGLLLLASLGIEGVTALIACLLQPDNSMEVLQVVGNSVLINLGTTYVGLVEMGLLTILSEWKRVHATKSQKLGYVLTFPVFMMTYLPISIAAAFEKVEWKPIAHHAAQRVPQAKCETAAVRRSA